MPSPEQRSVPPTETINPTTLPDDGWDISDEELGLIADTTIADTIPTAAAKEKRKMTPRKKNADGTRRTPDQILAEMKQSIEKSTDQAIYTRQMDLEKKQAFGTISKYEQAELQHILEKSQEKRDAKEAEALEVLISNLDTKPTTADTPVSNRGIPKQRIERTNNSTDFTALENDWFAQGENMATEAPVEASTDNATEQTEWQLEIERAQELWDMLIATQPKIKAIKTGLFGPSAKFEGRPTSEFNASESGLNLSNADKMIVWLDKKGRTEEANLIEAYTDAFVEYQKSVAEVTGVGNTGARGKDVIGDARADMKRADVKTGNIRGF